MVEQLTRQLTRRPLLSKRGKIINKRVYLITTD